MCVCLLFVCLCYVCIYACVFVFAVCGCHLWQGESQGQGPHQQKMRLDPLDRLVSTAHRIHRLGRLQVVLRLHPKATHGVDHCLVDKRTRAFTQLELTGTVKVQEGKIILYILG